MQRAFYKFFILSILPLLCMVCFKLVPEAKAQVGEAVSVSQAQSDNVRNQAQSAATLTALELQFKKECETPGTSTYCPSAAMAKRAAKASATASATTSATGTATSAVGGIVSDDTTSKVGSTTSTVGSATDTAGVRLACMALKCDATEVAKETCGTQCGVACAGSTFCQERCDNPSAVVGCHGECVAECEGACAADWGLDKSVNCAFPGGITSVIYQLMTAPISVGSESYGMMSDGLPKPKPISVSADYSSCIAGPKTSAIAKQASCRKLCRSIGSQTASLVRMSTQVAGTLSSVSGLVTGDKKGGKGTKSPQYSPDDTGYDDTTGTGSTHTGSHYSCAGKTGEALRECNCTAGGWNWVNGKCLDDDQLAFQESLIASSDPEGTKDDKAYEDEDNAETKIGDKGALAAGTGVGAFANAGNLAKGTSQDKELGKTSDNVLDEFLDKAGKKGSLDELNQDVLDESDEDDDDEDNEDLDDDYDEDSAEGIIGRKGSGLNSSRMNIFDSISKLYKSKYDAKVLGHLSIKKKPQSSDKKHKTKIIQKGNKGRERAQ